MCKKASFRDNWAIERKATIFKRIFLDADESILQKYTPNDSELREKYHPKNRTNYCLLIWWTFLPSECLGKATENLFYSCLTRPVKAVTELRTTLLQLSRRPTWLLCACFQHFGWVQEAKSCAVLDCRKILRFFSLLLIAERF